MQNAKTPFGMEITKTMLNLIFIELSATSNFREKLCNKVISVLCACTVTFYFQRKNKVCHI